jgi:hypothetical protein
MTKCVKHKLGTLANLLWRGVGVERPARGAIAQWAVMAAFGFVFIMQAAGQPPEVCFVSNLAGNGVWKDAQGGQIQKGQHLFAGTMILLSAGKGEIHLSYYDGSPREPHTAAFTVHPLPSQPKYLNVITAIYSKLSETRQPQRAMTRGASPLRAAVLMLREGKVEFAPSLGSLDPGKYNLELRPPSKATPVNVECRVGDTSAAAKVPGLQPGFFILTVTSLEGRLMGSVAIVIAQEQDYEAKNASFQEALKLTSQWPPDTGQVSIEEFLKLWLAEIADGARS